MPRDSHQELVFVCLRGFLSLGRRFERDFISEIFMCYDQALFCIHTGLVPAKNHFQPRPVSSQPAFPAWSVIQEITFSMRDGKPFWNGRAPGKGCFQPRAYSRPELFPALYSFQPHSDHPQGLQAFNRYSMHNQEKTRERLTQVCLSWNKKVDTNDNSCSPLTNLQTLSPSLTHFATAGRSVQDPGGCPREMMVEHIRMILFTARLMSCERKYFPMCQLGNNDVGSSSYRAAEEAVQ